MKSVEAIRQEDHRFFLNKLDPVERRTFWVCFSGWALDALDFMIYPLVVGTIIAMWHVDRGVAGLAVTASMIASAIGGWLAGFMSDRIGRVKTLRITIIWFCSFTLVCALVQNFEQMIVARTLLGFGFGGEWAAGAVLMGETIRAQYRGRAVGGVQSAWAVGWGAAVLLQAAVFSFVAPEDAWRAMFVLGAVPGIFLLFFLRKIPEPQIAREALTESQNPRLLDIFSRDVRRTTVVASIFSVGCQGGYYAIVAWIPTFLSAERGLSVVGSTGYLASVIFGSFAGYLFGAWFSDRFGRRTLFIAFSIAAPIVAVTYTIAPLSSAVIAWLGLPLGFFTSGYLSGVGPFLTELFPTRVRGSAQGFCYNFGRGIGSLFPTMVGFLSATAGLATSIAVFTAIGYGLLFITSLLLPETRGRELRTVQ